MGTGWRSEFLTDLETTEIYSEAGVQCLAASCWLRCALGVTLAAGESVKIPLTKAGRLSASTQSARLKTHGSRQQRTFSIREGKALLDHSRSTGFSALIQDLPSSADSKRRR
jgi:hypothetical protein